MSIKIMSAIFETEFRDLPLGEEDRMAKASSLKIVMLALADHANDEGEAYPGFVRLILKTSLSRQGLTDVLKALKHNGIVAVGEEKSKLGSNLYQIDLDCFPKLADKSDKRLVVKWLDQSSGFELGSQVASDLPVKPLDHNHQLTAKEPLIGVPPTLPLEWQIAGNTEKITEVDDTYAMMTDAANLIATGTGLKGREIFDLAMAFQNARQIIFTESQIKGQRKAAKALLESKVKPGNISQAVRELIDNGMTVTDLYSVTKTAINLANPTPQTSGYNPQGLSVE